MFKNVREVVTIALLAGGVATAGAQEAAKPASEPGKPPELTQVSGRLLLEADVPTTGGVAYFVFQRRISEIPTDGAMARVREMAEAAVAIDKGGSFSLEMAPGNYLMVYDPFETETSNLKPGSDSQSVAKKLTKEQIDKRVALMKRSAEQGLAVTNGALPGGFVIENRIIKPPITEFGEMILGAVNRVTVKALAEDGAPLPYPAVIKLRGKNGEIYEAHPPAVSELGTYVYHDVFTQRYDAFGEPTKPAPDSGDKPYVPIVNDGSFVFEGGEKDVTVKIVREEVSEEEMQKRNAAPTPPPGAKQD